MEDFIIMLNRSIFRQVYHCNYRYSVWALSAHIEEISVEIYILCTPHAMIIVVSSEGSPLMTQIEQVIFFSKGWCDGNFRGTSFRSKWYHWIVWQPLLQKWHKPWTCEAHSLYGIPIDIIILFDSLSCKKKSVRGHTHKWGKKWKIASFLMLGTTPWTHYLKWTYLVIKQCWTIYDYLNRINRCLLCS